MILGRPKHPIKELEALLREAEAKGWRVTKGRKYYALWCSCPGKHWKTVHLTPSDINYERHLRGKLKRDTCWEEETL